MRTKQITAQLFEVARDMTIKRGQYVMVVADMVVGIYTGVEVVPIDPRKHPGPNIEEHEREAALKMERNARLGVKPPRKRKPNGDPNANSHIRRGKTPSSGVKEYINLLHPLFLKHDRLSMRGALDMLGVDKRDTKTSWRPRDAIYWMRDWGWIRADGNTHDKAFTRTDMMPEELPDVLPGRPE